ncbi:IS200/IS605 family transposase [Succinatimonas hippei]|uniref:IS200/IS605 family transposase n=1 Tax=Succinatimonas hippei TaxID=626938 RepID=UPI003D17CF92
MFANVCLKFNSELIEFNGEEAHVHLLILNLPKLSGSKLIFKLKGTSSMLIRKRKYPAVRAKLWDNMFRSLSFLLHLAQVLRYLLSVNILSSRKHLIKN